MLGHEDPDPITHREVGDTGADGVHHSGAVVVGDHLGEFELLARARPLPVLPVGRVDTGKHDAHPHLPGIGVGNLTVLRLQNRDVACSGVGDRLHETHNAMRGGRCSNVPARVRRAPDAAITSPRWWRCTSRSVPCLTGCHHPPDPTDKHPPHRPHCRGFQGREVRQRQGFSRPRRARRPGSRPTPGHAACQERPGPKE